MILGILISIVALFFLLQKPAYQQAFEAFDDPILFFNKKQKVLFSNKAFVSFFDLLKNKNRLVTDLEVSKKKDLFSEMIRLIKRALEDDFEIKETFFYKVKEQSFAINIKITPLEKGLFILVIKELDQEKRDFCLGKEFIANATHELRTPIAIIRGFIETLKDLESVSQNMLEDIFDKVLRSCHRMDEIVKNLLILTDLDHLVNLKKRECDIDSLITNVIDLTKQRYPQAIIEVKAPEVISNLNGDLPLLEIAFSNLVHNAIKYSKMMQKVIISVEEDPDFHYFSILDFGIGIPSESLPYIFDRFYAVNKTLSRKLGGAGLGLSIVKTIIDKHQGKIEVENNPEGGSIFNIAIPKL